jgi:nucleotide-binding universal stress UspA family protein
MDKRILLLTDFSRNALNAVRYALDLYSDQKCIFYFLNTYNEGGYSLDSHAYNHSGQRSYNIEKPNTKEGYKDLMQALSRHKNNPKHSFYTIATNNSLLQGVKDVIAKNDIDIIVMGTKGITSSRTVVFGMNTITIMENVTECPVLAIPEDVEFTHPKEIVFPTDYKLPFKRRELKYLINIAKMHDSFIRVLHVKESAKLTQVQQGNKELLNTIFKEVGHSFHELEDMRVQAGINAFIDSRDSDMVAFVNQKRNFFSRIMSKPLVKELGYQSRVPVLVLKHRI